MLREGMGEFPRAQLAPGERVIDRQVERDVGKHDDAPAVEHRAHPVNSLRDLGFA